MKNPTLSCGHANGSSTTPLELKEGVHRTDETAHSYEVLQDDNSNSCGTFFEGPEKLLELWFATSVQEVASRNLGFGPREEVNGILEGAKAEEKLIGLRRVARNVWEQVLDLVNCKILSVIVGEDVDAYLLSESSMFVWPHKFILKTCGKTTLLRGLQSIIDIAKNECGLPNVTRLFYSHKSFMFPEQQLQPHNAWANEVAMLQKDFNGSAHQIGNRDGDHWMLYTASSHSDWSPKRSLTLQKEQDFTIEILMSGLSQKASSRFYAQDSSSAVESEALVPGHASGLQLLSSLGLDDASLFGNVAPDAFLFTPCGFSANLITASTDEESGSGGKYATYHVTPEQGWSFASFESNIDFSGRSICCSSSPSSSHEKSKLVEVVKKIANVFEPQRMTISLFVSKDGDEAVNASSSSPAIEATLVVLRNMMKNNLIPGFESTSDSVHDFDEYHLMFATFERVD